jgi:ParB family transcriptional regulator, chromosome partitioning protein
MGSRPKRPSPILSTASAMIGDAYETLVTKASRFHHSFEVDVAAVSPDADQARKMFSELEIAALAATMAEHGQLQPILVRASDTSRRRWKIVAGERRWRAARLNEWKTIVAIEHDGDPEVLSLIENLQRVDLNPVEEARGLQRLLQGKKWTQDHAAEVLGKLKSEVSGLLRILTLPDDVLDQVQTSELDISKSVLMEWARLDQTKAHGYLARLAMEGRLTVRAIRAIRDSGEPAVGSGGGAGGAAETKSAVPKVSAKALDKIALVVRGAREGGVSLAPKQRASLEALRVEIDKLLGGAGDQQT